MKWWLSLKAGVFSRFSLFNGRVSAYLFGRPNDWSIVDDNSEEALWRLSFLCDELSIRKLLVPNPRTFNAELCGIDDLTPKIMSVLNSREMYHGCDADGIDLEVGDAFWLSSADCAAIVALDPVTGRTIAAHGGRDSLIDRATFNGKEHRANRSVVHAIVRSFGREAVARLKVSINLTIGPDSFTHPFAHEEYGQQNMDMILSLMADWGDGFGVTPGNMQEGRICLSELIRSQFVHLGVAPHNIAFDGIDTFADRDPDGQHVWWSYRRGDGPKRNGVLVVREW